MAFFSSWHPKHRLLPRAVRSFGLPAVWGSWHARQSPSSKGACWTRPPPVRVSVSWQFRHRAAPL